MISEVAGLLDDSHEFLPIECPIVVLIRLGHHTSAFFLLLAELLSHAL